MIDASPLMAKAAAAFKRGFGAVLKVEPSDGAVFYIDGRSATCAVVELVHGASDSCTWRAPAETLLRIFEGGRALESAYLSGRVAIAGDMSVMARLHLENSR